jgi:hypothetical protein
VSDQGQHIQLSPEESKRLRDAGRARRGAAVAADVARSAFAKAEDEYQQTLEALAEAHDFDPAEPMQFDDRAHTLTPVPKPQGAR